MPIPATLACTARLNRLAGNPPADHGAHEAGLRIDRDERGLKLSRRMGTAAAFDLLQAFLDSTFRGLLHVRVQRRVDTQTTFENALEAEAFDELLPDLLEVQTERLVLLKDVLQRHACGPRGIEGRTIDQALAKHGLKDDPIAARRRDPY